MNLTAEQPSKSLTNSANGHSALVFHNSRYINEDILLLANHPESHGFICITFYISGDHEQTILSNFQTSDENWHEISTSKTEINIWGKENGKTKRVTIHHAVLHKWTTLFVEQVTTENGMHGPMLLITIQNCYHGMFSGSSVGSIYDNTRFLQGKIASIEMYHGKGNKQIPQVIKDLVIKNQLIESSPPPGKKKKKI